MRVALRLIALAVGLAAAGAAAAGTKQPSLASIGATAAGEENDYLASANLCASLVDQVNARDRSSSNAFRESSAPDWRADDKTIADCRSQAGRGDAAAAYALGIMYRKGLGVPQDPAEAAKWLRKSADLGLARAQTSLGAMYAFGEGVPQSRAEAMKWTKAGGRTGRRSRAICAGTDVLRRPRRSAGSCPGPHVAQSRGRAGPEAGRRGPRPGRGMDRVAGRDRQSAADGGRAQRGGGAAGGRDPAEAVTETRALGYSVESPRALPVGRDDHRNPLARDAAELERERTGRQIELDALARPFAVLRAAERDRMQVGPAVKHVDPGRRGTW